MDKKILCVHTKQRGFCVYETRAALDESDDTEKDVVAEINRDDYLAAGRIVRYENGSIILGRTDAEKEADGKAEAVRQCRKNLSDTDYVAYKLAEVSDDAAAYSAMKTQYAEILASRAKWRNYISENS